MNFTYRITSFFGSAIWLTVWLVVLGFAYPVTAQFTSTSLRTGSNTQNGSGGWLSGPLCTPSNITSQTFTNWEGSGVNVTYGYSTNMWDGDAPNLYVAAGQESAAGAGCDSQFVAGVNDAHCASIYHGSVRFTNNIHDTGGTPGNADGPAKIVITYNTPVILTNFRIGSISNIGSVVSPGVEWVQVKAFSASGGAISIATGDASGSYIDCAGTETVGGMTILSDATGGLYVGAQATTRQADGEYGNVDFSVPSSTPVSRIELYFWRNQSTTDPTELAGRSSYASFTLHQNVVAPSMPPSCTINSPTITPLCNNAGTTNTGGDDTFTFTVNTTGSGVGTNYVVKDGTTTLGTVNYGTTSASFGPFPIASGLRQLSLEDVATGTCTRPAHANPPAPCSADCTTIMNCSEVSAVIESDPNSTPNNGANSEDDYACYAVSVCTPPPSSADLELTKTSSSPFIRPGDTLTFTLTLVNKGPGTAMNVVVRDVLPASLSFISATTATGSYSNGTGLWTLGNIAPGTYTLTINATVN
ncbi:MAG TPA: DUF11 domain-containing protein [Rhodothermales bacterium]|nr:DUF11 domain-containing protein [Rhodothermales bacterium]